MEPEGDDAAQASSPPTPSGTPAPPASPAIISLPQEELDRLLGQRVAETKRATTKGFLADLGVNSVDEAKALVKAHKEAELAAMTEADRLRAEAAEAKATYEQQSAALATERHSLSVERALAAAGAQGDLAKVSKLVDVEVGADATAVQAAVDATKTQFAALFGAATATPAPSEPSGGGAPSRPSPKPDALSRGEEKAKARNPEVKRSFL
jgi:hypothetical protein